MNDAPLIISPAQTDPAAWERLGRGAELGESSFITWQRHEPIARFTLHQMGSVVAVNNFTIGTAQAATHGPALLQQVIALARTRGKMVTAEYPAEYSPLFLNAYFKQNTRTRMALSLGDYQPQVVRLPVGITLRHPTPDDEAALIEHVYAGYLGSADHDMVCSDQQQAAMVVHDTLANAYCNFDWDNSFLAVEAEGNIVGNVLLGDISEVASGTALIANISILPAWQGKGLGRALMATALNAARASGYHTARLLITIGNWPAHKLYRSFGFVEQGPVRYEAALVLS